MTDIIKQGKAAKKLLEKGTTKKERQSNPRFCKWENEGDLYVTNAYILLCLPNDPTPSFQALWEDYKEKPSIENLLGDTLVKSALIRSSVCVEVGEILAGILTNGHSGKLLNRTFLDGVEAVYDGVTYHDSGSTPIVFTDGNGEPQGVVMPIRDNGDALRAICGIAENIETLEA